MLNDNDGNGNASDWLEQIFSQSEALPRSG